MKQALLVTLILVAAIAIVFVVIVFDVGRHTPTEPESNAISNTIILTP